MKDTTSSTQYIHNGLRKCRKECGLSQTDVARMLRLRSAAIISRWEQGVSLPSIRNAIRLAVLYQTMMDSFFLDLRWSAKRELKRRR
jgi:transcriptional regulator with XRE-family HTH domain